MDKGRRGILGLYWPSSLELSPIRVYPGQQFSEIMTQRMVFQKKNKWP